MRVYVIVIIPAIILKNYTDNPSPGKNRDSWKSRWAMVSFSRSFFRKG
jgi:hypothetical protein